MFDRELVELVTISKSAIKLKLVPWSHVVFGVPSRFLMLVASATRTSLAVQFSASDDAVDPAAAPFAMLYSFCKQVCANAGAASVSVPSKLKAKAVHQHRKSLFPFLKLIYFFSSVFPDREPLDRAWATAGPNVSSVFPCRIRNFKRAAFCRAGFKPAPTTVKVCRAN